MRLKTLRLLVLCMLMSGCTTFGQMKEGLNALIGEKDTVAFSVLGLPDGKYKLDNDIVYVWSSHNYGTFITPQTMTTTGMVGGVPTYATTTYNEAVPYNFNCTIKIVISNKKTIKYWSYKGNLGGCEPYINNLNKYTKSKKTNTGH